MAKHQSKPQVYKSHITVVRYKTCRRHRLQAYLLQSEERNVQEATAINKDFVFLEI